MGNVSPQVGFFLVIDICISPTGLDDLLILLSQDPGMNRTVWRGLETWVRSLLRHHDVSERALKHMSPYTIRRMPPRSITHPILHFMLQEVVVISGPAYLPKCLEDGTYVHRTQTIGASPCHL